jgi:hypothetical protein
MSAHEASYPVEAVDVSTSGAAYMTEPTCKGGNDAA